MLPRARSRRAAILSAVATVLAAVALAGCGGTAVTRAGVIARGNAICATAARQLANLPTSGGTANFVKAAPIVTREATSLAALPRPAASRTVLDRFVAAESALAAGYRHLAAIQLAGGADQSVIQALAGNRAPSLARQYGLRQCAAVTATVR